MNKMSLLFLTSIVFGIVAHVEAQAVTTVPCGFRILDIGGDDDDLQVCQGFACNSQGKCNYANFGDPSHGPVSCPPSGWSVTDQGSFCRFQHSNPNVAPYDLPKPKVIRSRSTVTSKSGASATELP